MTDPKRDVDARWPGHSVQAHPVPAPYVYQPGAGLSLRRLRGEDFGLLRRARLMALEDVPFAFATGLAVEQKVDDDEWRRRAETSVWAVATEGSAIVGLAELTDWPPIPDARFIQSVWVARGHRGRERGVVDQLINFLEGHAPAEVHRLLLWVFEGNTPARKAYERLDFHYRGDREPLPTWCGEVTECLMERSILANS